MDTLTLNKTKSPNLSTQARLAQVGDHLDSSPSMASSPSVVVHWQVVLDREDT